jgi:hypothetical protein
MRRARLSRRCGVILALLCCAFVASGTALADTVVNQTIPFTGTSYNDCTDELVAVEGQLHIVTRTSVSGSRVHTGVAMHSTGVKGTALVSGARYVEMDVENQETNFSTDFAPSEFTYERTHNLTRLGEDGSFVSGDDLRVHVIAHMTVNANGTVTANKTDTDIECR